MRENFSYNLVKALEIKKEHFLDVIVHNFYQKEIIFKPNIFSRKSRQDGGLLSWKSRQEGESCASKNSGETGG